MKVEIKYPQTKCAYCGKTFTKTHNRQKYCSTTCSQNADKEKQQLRSLKHFYKNRDRIYAKQLGTRTIGPHKNPDQEREQEIIQKEKQRLGLTFF